MSQEKFLDDQLWLGIPDEKISTTAGSNLADALYKHRIGGQPILMYNTNTSANPQATKDQLEVLKCPTCKSNHDVCLLSQVFAPLFDQDRILYVFICRKCAKSLTHLQSKGNGDLAKHFDKAIFAVRCQNFTQDAVKKYDDLFGSADQQQQQQQKVEQEQQQQQKAPAAKTSGAFAEQDDWGDDDDEADSAAKKKAASAAAALVNVAAQKLQDQAEAKRQQEELEMKRKSRPAKKPVVQKVTPVFGLNPKANQQQQSKAFAEYTLDIYDYDEDAASDGDDDDDSDDDDGEYTPVTASQVQNSAELKRQFEELRKRFPNAEIDDGTGAASSNTKMFDELANTNALNIDDKLNDDDDDDNDEVKKSKNKRTQEANRQKELQMQQFDLFVKRLTRQDNTQVIRWHPDGFPLLAAPVPLLASPMKKKEVVAGIPKCDRCGCDRMFEYQLVSPLIYFLTRTGEEGSSVVAKKQQQQQQRGGASASSNSKSNNETIDEEEILNFATILVFTCSNPYCDIGNEYVRDHVIVQQEPVMEQSQLQQQQQAAVLATKGRKQ